MIIVPIISFLIIAGALLVGLRYMGSYTISEKEKSPQLLNKQKIVKERREEFGASNRGTSMDNEPIHIISYNDLGINE